MDKSRKLGIGSLVGLILLILCVVGFVMSPESRPLFGFIAFWLGLFTFITTIAWFDA